METNRMNSYKSINNLELPCQEFNNILYSMYNKTVCFMVEVAFYKGGKVINMQTDVIFDMKTLWFVEGGFNQLITELKPDSVDVYVEPLNISELVELIKRGD